MKYSIILTITGYIFGVLKGINVLLNVTTSRVKELTYVIHDVKLGNTTICI
jgi:hypothetical protein